MKPDRPPGPALDWSAILDVSAESVQPQMEALNAVALLLASPNQNSMTIAATHIVGALGAIAEFVPVSLPFGYEKLEFEIKHEGWVLEKHAVQITTQALLLCDPTHPVDLAPTTVGNGLKAAIACTLIEARRYDSWRPGMPSGSGWTRALRQTVAGRARLVTYARESVLASRSRKPVGLLSWLTVTEAATLLLNDVSDLSLGTAKTRVTRAADREKFRTNGKGGPERRIDPDSFSTWRLEQREKDLDECD